MVSLLTSIAPTTTRCIFDSHDVDIFVSRFIRRELQKELENATDHKRSLDDFYFWADYTSAIELTLDILEYLRLNQPKPTVKHPGKRLDVDGAKARTDIVAMIEQYTKLRKSGSRFIGCCPIHQDKAPSLTVYPDQQSWYCFGACNAGGDAIAFIMAMEHCDFKEAVISLGG